MRRPVVSLLVAGGALVALTIPLFTIETGLSGASTFPEDLRVSRGFAALQEDFGFGADAPVNIVLEGDIDAPATTAAIDELRAALAEDPSFGPSSLQVSEAGDVALIAVPVVGDPNSEAADRPRRGAPRRCPQPSTARRSRPSSAASPQRRSTSRRSRSSRSRSCSDS